MRLRPGIGRGITAHDYYFNAAGRPIAFPGGDFASWQQKGQDQHSRIADPRFANPDRGDFTLRADSPAFAVGFMPLDMSKVGPR